MKKQYSIIKEIVIYKFGNSQWKKLAKAANYCCRHKKVMPMVWENKDFVCLKVTRNPAMSVMHMVFSREFVTEVVA